MTVTITPATEQDAEFGGVDSHTDTIHVAVVTDRGGHVADAEFLTTAGGYAAAIAFLNAHGTVTAVGVEGTSCYGLGFTRAARQAGLTVVEVNRPDKAERRRIGRSDRIDAYTVARAALSGRALVIPKDDTVSGIRALHNAAPEPDLDQLYVTASSSSGRGLESSEGIIEGLGRHGQGVHYAKGS